LAGLRRSHADHLNTPRLVADATGTTVWRWDQAEPFGNNPADEDPDGDSIAFDLPLRLPGQRYDAETGLHYNYFRDYDPSLGRFGESDPIGLDGGLNTYAYVYGRPLKLFDKRGLDPMTCMLGGPCDPGDIPPMECVENPEKCFDPLRDRGDPKFNCTVRCSVLSLAGLYLPEKAVELGGEALARKMGGEAAKATCKAILGQAFVVVRAAEVLSCRNECYRCEGESCPLRGVTTGADFPTIPPMAMDPFDPRRTRR
jgi:RHS repeat-associated protein